MKELLGFLSPEEPKEKSKKPVEKAPDKKGKESLIKKVAEGAAEAGKIALDASQVGLESIAYKSKGDKIEKKHG